MIVSGDAPECHVDPPTDRNLPLVRKEMRAVSTTATFESSRITVLRLAAFSQAFPERLALEADLANQTSRPRSRRGGAEVANQGVPFGPVAIGRESG